MAGFFDSFLGGLFGVADSAMRTNMDWNINQANLNYQKERNEIEDARYADETAYNREFAENERDYNRAFAENERDYNRAFAEQERNFNQRFAEDQFAYNREFAENERAYNRDLQQEIFNREDTALERQAESLSKMGINPLSQSMNGLGAGQAITSSLPSSVSSQSVGSPRSSYSSSKIPSLSSRGGQALHNAMQFESFLSPVLSLLNSINGIQNGEAQRDLLREQKDFQSLQNQAQEIENTYLAEKRSAEIEDIKSSSSSKRGSEKRAEEKQPYEVENIRATAERNERENQFQKDWNVTDKTNNYARTGADFGALVSTETEKQKQLEENSPLNIMKNTLTNSAKVVAKSIAKTFDISDKALNSLKKKKSKWFYTPKELEKQYRR